MTKSTTRRKPSPLLLHDTDEAPPAPAGDEVRAHRGVNNLNDLNTREWLLATKSVWYTSVDDFVRPQLEELTSTLRNVLSDPEVERVLEQILPSVMESRPGPRDAMKAQHPATFAESDVEKLLNFFTKRGDRVLDPFLGSGTTLIACHRTGRLGTGVELVPKWYELAQTRLAECEDQQLPFDDAQPKQELVQGDSREVLARFAPDTFGFIITSPPYWSVLNKPADHKVKAERVRRGLATNYSDSEADLGNVGSYGEFLGELKTVFEACFRVLQTGRYVAVIVSDFRDKSEFFMYHADIATVLRDCGFSLSGITVLVQDSKTLYPYGMPHAFVSNIHHQYVVVARKRGSQTS